MKASVLKLKKQVQRGFTLVEIAIVLVIIGLLIGGVLRGQELINSARVNNINSQLSSVQTAYYGFIDRYKALPGDLTSAQAIQINNSTAPAAVAAAAGDGNILANDSIAFFNNLAQAGFLTCSQCSTNSTITAGTAGAAATYIPAAISATNSLVNVYTQPLVFVYNTGLTSGTTADAGSTTAGAIVFMDATATTSKPLLTTGTGVSSAMLAEIDRKVDEGTPAQGSFRYTDLIGSVITGTPFTSLMSAANSAKCWSSTTSGGPGGTTTYSWTANPPATCQGVLLF